MMKAMELPERLKTNRYTDANGNLVFTERFLLRQGCCCGNGCCHCPYEPKHKTGERQVRVNIEKAKNRMALRK